ncbi:MAG: sugar ABC transporter permease [Bifidobacteriaceae bacterium]|jgi:multiple sugar transport system permease protein|nr:sugar ABC transporter permease [Bifidobacteriaceae bacterium]
MTTTSLVGSRHGRAAKAGSRGASRSRRARRANLAGYAFLTPWLIGLTVFTIGPLLASLVLSFTDYSLIGKFGFVGWSNYVKMLTADSRYLTSLRVTFVYVLVSVPLQLVFALLLAMLLNRPMRGVGWYRAAYYLPSLLGSSVAVAVMWRQVFGRGGVVNSILGAITGIETLPNWVQQPSTSLLTLILLRAWQFGAPMVIFLAGLKQIPREYYEAAQVDGASKARQFFSITIPMLSPVLFFNIVMQVIGAFQAFLPAYIVSGGSGGPADSTLFYTLYIYQTGFSYFHMGYASALAWTLLVMIAGATGLLFWTSRYWVHYQD